MHRVRISDISMGHYLKLFGRSAMFLASLSLYITGRLAEELIRDFTAARVFAMFIWAVFMIEMLMKYFPLGFESMGCQKQFAKNYIPAKNADDVPEKDLRIYDRGALLILIFWIMLNGIVAVLYFTHIIDRGILVLISLLYSVSDMICILFFCPFQTWFMKNKCCISCRIYTWDYILMFTPLLMIRNFFTWSLCITALGLMLRWEYIYRKHPERFSDRTNLSLHCSRCREKLCSHKKQLRSFHRKIDFRGKLERHTHRHV
ncbi:MAG: hypothetical protein V8Q42_03345 [Anaerovoracaceae bacterium]